MTLYRDMLMRDRGYDTPPIVWLTINPILEMTVVTKMTLGRMRDLVGQLHRVVLPDGYAGDLGLGEYTDQAGIDPDWWTCVVQTGAAVGSHYTTWRVCPRDIPAADWLAVEVLAGFGEHGTAWAALPRGWEVIDD